MSPVYLQDVARERNEGRPALIFTFIRGLRSSQSIADCIVCSIQSNSITPAVVDVDIVCPTVSSLIIYFHRTIIRSVKILASFSLSLSFSLSSPTYDLIFASYGCSYWRRVVWILHPILYIRSCTNIRIVDFGEMVFKWFSQHSRYRTRIINYIFSIGRIVWLYERILSRRIWGERIGGNDREKWAVSG